MRALDRKLLRDLWRMKGQVAAIAVVVAAGIAMFTLYRSAFDSLGLSQRTYYGNQRFADVFAGAKRVPEGIARRLAGLPGVAEVETRVVADVTLDVAGMEEPAVGRLVSIPAVGRPALNDLFLRQGRWIAPGRRDEVLVSEAFARKHALQPGDRLAALINGRRRQLEIAGIALSPEYIYSIRPGDLLPDPARFGILWMDRQAVAAAFDLEGAFNDVVLRLAPGADGAAVLEAVDRQLAAYGGLGAIPRSLQASHWFVSNEIQQLHNVGNVLPMIFLAVAAFLLNVVLTRTVGVQREQIAALKAVGYGVRELALHYLGLALVIAALGAVVGVAAGAWMGLGVTALYTELFNLPVLRYELEAARLVQAAAVALAAASLGALGAISRVVQLPPAEAMRPEAPALYSHSALERLGLRRWLSPPLRMILRNLSQRPLRTAVAVFGVAAGGSLVVVSATMGAAVDALLAEQFGVLQRQDATVTFTEPVSARALHELARYPGVVAVEPLRSAPVRLRFGPVSRQTAVQGLLDRPRLQRVVDGGRDPVTLPADGLLLSSLLAEVLGAQAGDVVTLEVLSGRRPVRRLPVVRVVEQHMGLSAWMRLDSLQNLLGEGRSLSGAFLEVEPSRTAALYRRLKATPRVAAVSLTAAFLTSFEESFAKNLNVMLTFTMLFATLIAFGVVYNSARISLAERSRELASLRVLGFRKSEISFIFLGELAVVILLALPGVFLLGAGLTTLAFSAFNSELYHFPLHFTRQSFALAGLIVTLAALASGLAVRRQLDRLDLIAVLKTRE